MGRLAVAVIVTVSLIPISFLVNRIVPDPYMDEIFHVPQAQQYCRGNFRSWDPMITTPPGLYFLSLAYVASLFPGLFCLQPMSSLSDWCSTSLLRSTNIISAVICSILFYEIITHLKPSIDDKRATLHAVTLSLYPLHWFFVFLYYTDVASVTAVLAMYLLSLKKRYFFSSLLGAFSVLIRQTNIIWVLFAACTGVIEFCWCHRKDNAEAYGYSTSMEKHTLSKNDRVVPMISNLRKRTINKVVDGQNDLTSRTSVHVTHGSGLFHEIQEIIMVSWHHPLELFLSFSPFAMILMAFALFVYWNGSIVLGAKSAHSVSPHFAQMLYYAMVSTIFMAPVHLSLGQAALLFRGFCKSKLLGIIQWLALLTIGFLSVKFFSIAHPYLLADNRHYPFYLWRKIINYHWSSKYLMVPLYIYSWFSILKSLDSQRKTWALVYLLACSATLIPSPLIEFRYYTIPFFFLILHTHINDDRSWILMAILYFSVNCFTMYMFLFRPFSWKHEAGTQRFIW